MGVTLCIFSGLFPAVKAPMVDTPCFGQDAAGDQAYLGSKRPGKEAVPFASEFFAKAGDGYRFGVAITDNGRECYYAVAFDDTNGFREEIRFTRLLNDKWTSPKPLLDERLYKYVDPHLSPDQSRLYFIYTKPTPDSDAPKSPPFDIYYVQRAGDGWGEPINVGTPMSTARAHEYFVSLTTDRTIYFGSNREGEGFDLYAAKLETNGQYGSPMKLPGQVNTSNYEADVFVAPDESYVIFCSNGRDDSRGQGDLYVSFRDSDGSWGAAINMGDDINTQAEEFAPSVSRDGKYLFFSRGGTIYWVQATVVERLRP